ncbi:MAG: peptidoglycan-binding domain-containing protein [Pseudomonadota bacterium]
MTSINAYAIKTKTNSKENKMLFRGLNYTKLNASVGNNMENEEEDVIAVKRTLKNRGYYKPDIENGIVDRETDRGIKAFQRDNNLKEDGIMRPQGETEKTLFDDQSGQSNKPIKVAAAASPFIIQLAGLLGVTTATAMQIWQTMSEDERKRVLAAIRWDKDVGNKELTDDEKEKIYAECEEQERRDLRRCNRLFPKNPQQYRICESQAKERFAACIRGRSGSDAPPPYLPRGKTN